MSDDRPHERRRMAAEWLGLARQTCDVQFRLRLLVIARQWLDLASEEDGLLVFYPFIETMIGQELRDQFELPHELPDQMLALLSQLDGGARQVPDALSRAARYHERADDCAKLAEAATDDRVREHYRQMAQNYLNRARSELARLEPERAVR